MIKKIIGIFEKKKIISWICLIATWIIMFYFSSIPGGSIGFGSIWPSIIYHFTIFAGFAFFLTVIIKQKKIGKKEIFLVLVITLVFAILDEIHQIFVPMRSAGIQDVLTDLSGAIVSVSIYYFVKKD